MEFLCALNDPGTPRYIGFVMSAVKLIIRCNRGGSKLCVVTDTGIVHIHRVSVTVQSNTI